MQIYLVGGAVRDRLLGLPVHDRDWVVVGATPEAMQALGYRPVGRDFPVFLHPETGEEYALARTERKQGQGYRGFVVCADPSVTLEEDLQRRDLTINAMAENSEGVLIDPWGGQIDLQQRLLRAVSPAFAEDPLRVLRTARFAARFAELGFQVEAGTMQLMQQLVHIGEMQALTPERCWIELEKALQTPSPSVFFHVLQQVGALQVLWPGLFGHLQRQPGNLVWLDRLSHLQLTQKLALLGWQAEESFAADLYREIKMPQACFRQLQALLRAQGSEGLAGESAEAVMQLYDLLDAWRQPQLLETTLELLEALQQTPVRQSLVAWQSQLQGVSAAPLVAAGLKGPAVGEALHQQRLERLRQLIKS
ncbi:hypothetical protein [Marinospirillum alkaliphilum]|uniref:tRNA nucleotidyltransferase (CCA-adding enzyme) n=1 Tax=Marinospirillum alkaliphilum DSM 21637 TaxID=1122209 RepID=A0A1K1VHH8_9GAMM|nr:hypothetical protein [Marinospirillum alkaliphilum]SFX24633.1 tRNA nucleotidyltransferase (CCA-adding enzyme) [Marinospirillum alkaliphilum DSM 21637]